MFAHVREISKVIGPDSICYLSVSKVKEYKHSHPTTPWTARQVHGLTSVCNSAWSGLLSTTSTSRIVCWLQLGQHIMHENHEDITKYARYVYLHVHYIYSIIYIYIIYILCYLKIIYTQFQSGETSETSRLRNYDTLASPDQPLDQILSQLLGELDGHSEFETKLLLQSELQYCIACITCITYCIILYYTYTSCI